MARAEQTRATHVNRVSGRLSSQQSTVTYKMCSTDQKSPAEPCDKRSDRATRCSVFSFSCKLTPSRVPPLPSHRLRRLSLLVAFSTLFTVHLHEASLLLIVSRAAYQLPDRGHGFTTPLSEPAVSRTAAAVSHLARASQQRPPSPRSFTETESSDHYHHLNSLPTGRSSRRHAENSNVLLFSSSVSRLSDQYGAEHSGNLTAFTSSYEVLPSAIPAAGRYFLQTCTYLLTAPSPLRKGVPLAEDIVIAWHLLFQAVGCLLCGVAADAKGRRWVLSYAIRMLAASSVAFTCAALCTAQLPSPSPGHSGEKPAERAAHVHFPADEVVVPTNSNPFEEAARSGPRSADDRHSRAEASTASPLPRQPTGLPPVELLPYLSTASLWAVFLHIAVFVSIACYSLSAVACGGAAVVALCLCLEAAAPFPLHSSGATEERCSNSAEWAGEVSPTTAHARVRSARRDAETLDVVADPGVLRKEARSDSEPVRSCFADVPVDSNICSERAAELRSPLLVQRLQSPTYQDTARYAFNQLYHYSRLFCSTVWAGCTSACAVLGRIYARSLGRPLSSTWRMCASLAEISETPLFFSSPYTAVAYLVGMQSAAFLVFPVALSTILKALPVPSLSEVNPSALKGKGTTGPIAPFALFCLAFSLPTLPFCFFLHVLVRRYLRENPYFLFQREVLLRRMSADCVLHTADARSVRPPDCLSPGAAFERDPSANPRTRPFPFFASRPRLGVRECSEERDNDPSPSGRGPSQSPASLGRQQGERLHRGCTRALGRRRASVEPASSPFRRPAPRRRAVSYSDPESCPSPRQDVSSSLTLSFPHDGHPAVQSAGCINSTCDAARGSHASEAEVICKDSFDGHVTPLPPEKGTSSREKPIPSNRVARVAAATISQVTAAQDMESGGCALAMAGARQSLVTDYYATGERTDPPLCTNSPGAVSRLLSVYRSYLDYNHSTSLLGVLLPAAFIGASLYLRGVFRFLLLDCVVVEQEAEGVRTAYAEDVRRRGLVLEPESRAEAVHVEGPSIRLIDVSADSPADSLFRLSSPSLGVSGAFLQEGRSAQSIPAELLLFRLAIPVLFVRFFTCAIPVLLLSTLPPKPLQMLGCIVCGFLSFGIAVTLEALTQNFPNIPPISSSSTACLLYEIVFCFCSSVPAFTSVFLPLQGFHTGVRCGFAGTVLATMRAAAATSLVGTSVLLSALTSTSCAEDSSSAGTPASARPALIARTSVVGASGGDARDRTSLLPRSAAEGSACGTDKCSGDAAVIAATTCVYYVMAAASTLLYTTHLRLPRKSDAFRNRRPFRKKILQDAPLENELQHTPGDAEQRRIMQAAKLAREGTLVAVDRLLLQKLQPRASIIDDVGDGDRQRNAGREAEPSEPYFFPQV